MSPERRDKIERAAAVLLALAVWQAAAVLMGNRLLLVTPLEVLARLSALCTEREFWASVGFTSARISLGFFLGLFFGVALGMLAGSFRLFRTLLRPFVTAIKAVPAASFVILCLIWISARGLSVVISLLMVFPTVYGNVLQGIESTDKKTLELCRVFRVRGARRIKYIVLPQIKPYLRSACGIASGMAWKSGAAAEVIGIPSGSIGEKLYQAKIYLSTGDLFAWTLVIVLLSAAFERLLLLALNAAYRGLEAS